MFMSRNLTQTPPFKDSLILESNQEQQFLRFQGGVAHRFFDSLERLINNHHTSFTVANNHYSLVIFVML